MISTHLFILENEDIDDPDLYEGDMLLTADQRMAAEMGMDVDNPFGRGSTKNRQWPGGVMAYVIDSSLCKFVFPLKSSFICVMSVTFMIFHKGI